MKRVFKESENSFVVFVQKDLFVWKETYIFKKELLKRPTNIWGKM